MSDPLRAGPEDLAANHAGRLGPGQIQRRARLRWISATGFWLAGVALIIAGIVSHGNGGQWFVPALLGVLVLGVGVWRALSGRDEAGAPVRCLEGRVTVTVFSSSRGGSVLHLTVGGQPCHVGGKLADWEAWLTEPAYRVYVIGSEKLPDVVAVEPVEAHDVRA